MTLAMEHTLGFKKVTLFLTLRYDHSNTYLFIYTKLYLNMS